MKDAVCVLTPLLYHEWFSVFFFFLLCLCWNLGDSTRPNGACWIRADDQSYKEDPVTLDETVTEEHTDDNWLWQLVFVSQTVRCWRQLDETELCKHFKQNLFLLRSNLTSLPCCFCVSIAFGLDPDGVCHCRRNNTRIYIHSSMMLFYNQLFELLY